MIACILAAALAATDAIHAPDSHPLAGCPQYWTPREEGTWVGDVVVGRFQGRLHVFYLKDRHHHSSAQGRGIHYFAHVSAKDDLTDWMEHPDAIPLTEWWQTLGTGTPFVKDGRFCLAYGYHSERMDGWKELKLPAGATWAVSDDAVHFRPTGVMFHETRNPTVFNRPDGRFGMVLGYGGMGGMYVSDDLLKWEPVDKDLPGRGDCACYFTWNGHHYLLQGFRQMYHSATGRSGSWENWAGTGRSLYEGLSVPMVCEIADGRRIFAGWLRHPFGWGGWLVFRELKQLPDGTLSMVWPKGLATPVREPDVFRFGASEDARITYRTVQGHVPLTLEINAKARTAAWRYTGKKESAYLAGDFEIAGVEGLDKPYEVKIAAWYDARHDVTIFDAEIAGRRTMITRQFLRFERVTGTADPGAVGQVSWKTLDQFCKTNARELKGPVKGIVVEHPWLGQQDRDYCTKYVMDRATREGVVYMHVWAHPWSWMNGAQVKLTDRLVDVVSEHFGLGPDAKVVSYGISMGGHGALAYPQFSAKNVVAAVANCPPCDLEFHYTERPDLPRTLVAAYADESDFAAALRRHSPLASIETFKDIPYFIYQGDADKAVNKERHGDRFVAAAAKRAKGPLKVTYVIGKGRGHASIDGAERQQLEDAVFAPFVSTEGL